MFQHMMNNFLGIVVLKSGTFIDFVFLFLFASTYGSISVPQRNREHLKKQLNALYF